MLPAIVGLILMKVSSTMSMMQKKLCVGYNFLLLESVMHYCLVSLSASQLKKLAALNIRVTLAQFRIRK